MPASAKWGTALRRNQGGGIKSASNMATNSVSVVSMACFRAPAL